MSNIISNNMRFNILPREPLGKIIFERLKSSESDQIINIDARTGQVLTCGRLLQQSVKLARAFENLGLRKGDTIAIVSENSINYCVPIVSGLYKGITICMLNPSYLKHELITTLTYSKPKIIICSKRNLELVTDAFDNCKFVEKIFYLQSPNDSAVNDENSFIVGSIQELIESTNKGIENFELTEMDLIKDPAFVFMSSGTTGIPKGVVVNNECVRRCFEMVTQPEFGNLKSTDISLIVMPLFHVFGAFVHFNTILTRSKAVILEKFLPETFLSAIEKYRVTVLYLIPTLMSFLIKNSLVKNYNISTLNNVHITAAPLRPEVLTDFQSMFKNISVFHMYGATEIGGPIVVQRDGKIESVGNVIPGISAKVCQVDSLDALGPYEKGELCFKSDINLVGYLDENGLNRNCFDEEGFYHTGDVGYYDYVGRFYIIDRIKDMIKYKGFQVCPSEIETIIMSIPGVIDCVVVGIPDEKAGEVPVAYIVKNEKFNIDETYIIDYVAHNISSEKHLYGGVKFIKDIPKNAAGKVLRRKLKEQLGISNQCC